MRENEISVEIYDYGPLLSKEEIKGFGMKALNFLLAQVFFCKKKKCVDEGGMFDGVEAKGKGFYYKAL